MPEDGVKRHTNENPFHRPLFGRRQIFTPWGADDINDDNVVLAVNQALILHIQNYMDEEYLYWYRRGVQPILNRKKEIRPEICHKVVTNTADQICAFKNGFFPASTKPLGENTKARRLGAIFANACAACAGVICVFTKSTTMPSFSNAAAP